LNLRSNLSIVKRELLHLAPGEAVHHIMHFDPADESYLYVMTTYQVSRVKVATCGQYLTCQECLAADDAHCGWCTLESRYKSGQDAQGMVSSLLSQVLRLWQVSLSAAVTA
ncbi:hypothetical protein chiPu_0026419, partial [Chiloscyllium punctatum]|nr:hypothetical protein [Chiloscyllium punctatum]